MTARAVLKYVVDALREGILGPTPEVVGVDLSRQEMRLAKVRVSRDGYTAFVDTVCPDSADKPSGGAPAKAEMHHARVAAVVPRHLLTVRRVRLPSHDESLLSEMASFEATRMVPHDADQLTVAHHVTERCQDGSSLVTVVVGETRVLEQLVKELRSYGVEPDRLIPSPYAVQYAYGSTQVGAEADVNSQARSETVALVVAESDRLEVDVLEDGKVHYSRGIPLPNESDTPGVSGPTQLADEVRRSVAHGVRLDGLEEPKLLLVTGTGETAAHLQDALQQDGIVVGSLDLMCNGSRVQITNSSSEFKPSALAIGAGIAVLESGASSIDLLPAAFAKRQSLLQRWRLAGTAVFLAAICAVSLAGVMSRFQQRQEQRLALLKDMVREIRAEAADVQRKKERLDVLHAQLDTANSPLELLAKLHTAAPKELGIDTFHLESNDKVVITGQAESPSTVWRLQESLAETGVFGDVKILYVSSRSVRGIQIVAFKMECDLTRATSRSKGRDK